MNEPERVSVIGKYRIVPLTAAARVQIDTWHSCVLPDLVDREPVVMSDGTKYLVIIHDPDCPRATRPATPRELHVPMYQLSVCSQLANGGIVECYLAPDGDITETHFRGVLADQLCTIPIDSYQVLRVFDNGYVRASPRAACAE